MSRRGRRGGIRVECWHANDKKGPVARLANTAAIAAGSFTAVHQLVGPTDGGRAESERAIRVSKAVSLRLENYTFLTLETQDRRTNDFAGPRDQTLEGFSNAPNTPVSLSGSVAV